MHQQMDQSTPEGRAAAKLGFLNHFAVYVIVITVLAVINLTVGGHYLWFLWPLGGWGIGLAMHALSVFAFGPESGIYRRLLDHEKRRGTS